MHVDTCLLVGIKLIDKFEGCHGHLESGCENIFLTCDLELLFNTYKITVQMKARTFAVFIVRLKTTVTLVCLRIGGLT